MPTRRRAPTATSRASASARAGRRVIGFFHDCLRHTKGEWAGQPFTPLPWQRALLTAMFGTLRPDGLRRTAASTSRCRRSRARARCRRGSRSTCSSARTSPRLRSTAPPVIGSRPPSSSRRRGGSSRRARRCASTSRSTRTRSCARRRAACYRVLSADVPTKHGLNASGVIFDELHAQPTRELWDVLWNVDRRAAAAAHRPDHDGRLRPHVDLLGAARATPRRCATA